MKKTITVLLMIAYTVAIKAQTAWYTAPSVDFLGTPNNTSLFIGTDNIPVLYIDSATQYVSIGTGWALNNLAALAVANFTVSNTPTSVFAIGNEVPGTSLGTANSDFSMAVIRGDNTSSHNALALDMTIDANGLCGIGQPGSRFANGNTNAHLYVTDVNGDGYPLVATYTNSNTFGMMVDQNGYVGIGSYPSIGSYPFVPGNGISNAHLFITDPNSDGQPLLVTSVGEGVGLTVADNLNVGVGTLTPQSALDVSGGISVGTYAGSTAAPSNGMIISGQVGIGTSSPSGTLDVAGIANISTYLVIGTVSSTPSGYKLYVEDGILTEKVKVATSGSGDWSDYVFDKDYKLPTLSYVESYIKNNKHLPGVPSAEDVACDGIDLGSMDATLLKKIEELTLYTLKQQKEIESLEAQLSTLTK